MLPTLVRWELGVLATPESVPKPKALGGLPSPQGGISPTLSHLQRPPRADERSC